RMGATRDRGTWALDAGRCGRDCRTAVRTEGDTLMTTIKDLCVSGQHVTIHTLSQSSDRTPYTGAIVELSSEWLHLRHPGGTEWLIPIAAIAAVQLAKPAP